MDPSLPSTLLSMMPDIHSLAYRNVQPTRLKLVDILLLICAVSHALLFVLLQYYCFYFQYINMVKLKKNDSSSSLLAKLTKVTIERQGPPKNP